MNNKLLIWDIDGTLIDSMGSGRRAMDKTFLRLYNIENAFEKVNMAGRLDWQIVSDAIKINQVKENNIENFLLQYGKILNDELKNNNCGQILPGIKDILESTLPNKNMYHALGTGNCEQGARLKLSHLGLNTFFEIGGFGDDDLNRWQLIDKVINQAEKYYGVYFKNKDIYVIGDTPADIECGKILGVKSIAVATGAYKYDDLLKEKPDYIFRNFHSFSELLEVII